MAYRKHKQNYLIRNFFLGIASLALGVVVFANGVPASTAQEGEVSSQEAYQQLNQQIEEKKLLIDEVNQKIEQYEESLQVKRQEALSIEGQLTLLDSQITQTNADIERIRLESERAQLELDRLTLDIERNREKLEALKTQLAEYLRQLNMSDDRTTLDVLLTNRSISEYFDYIKSLEEIETTISQNLISLQETKQALEEEQNVQATKKDELTSLESTLSLTVGDLQSQQEYKATLLDQTQQNQQVFEDLLDQAQLEQRQINAEISTIEQEARDKLQDGGQDLLDSTATLTWPVISHNGISAYFQDPTYPFRKYFEHPAIDIRVPQGTALYAASDGYVARARNAGMGYSFIMIVHGNEISTVYGHVSRIDVSEDQYVVRGQQIGLSGGMPGTPGAGRLTTGPHLHFEVRLSGIPVNPLDYLP